MGGGEAGRKRALAEVWADYPDAIVVNGTDNWYADKALRPERFPGTYKVEFLAYFHTGTSGISSSGIVLSPEQYKQLNVAYTQDTGISLENQPRLRVYLPKGV